MSKEPQGRAADARPRAVISGIDGSDGSLAAALVAARLAEPLGLRVVLAHVDEGPSPADGDAPEELEGGRALLDRVSVPSANLELARKALRGDPAERLAELAVEDDATLIVVGSGARAAGAGATLGSVSFELGRAARRPVVVVPGAAVGTVTLGASELRPVAVCGVDGSEEAGHAADLAADLLAPLGFSLVLVHAFHGSVSAAALPGPGMTPPIGQGALDETQREGGGQIVEATARRLRGRVEARTRVEEGEPAATLDRVASEEGAELIVVGSRGRGAIASAVLGSTSSRLGATAARPVMVVSREASL